MSQADAKLLPAWMRGVEGALPVGVTLITAPFLPPNQQLNTMAKQPTRFSGRKPGYPMQLCLTSVAAARLFSDSICMSSNAVDMNWVEDETPKIAQWRNEANLFHISPFSTANATFAPLTEKPRSTFITEAAVKIRTGEFCQDRKQPFRAWKIGTNRHVAVALWDPESKIVEVFDPAGSARDNKITIIQEKLIRSLFTNHPGPPFDKMIFTNRYNLQELPSDRFCQTWIYWYLYERIIRKKSIKETLESAHKLHPELRQTMIASFWHFLETKT